MALIEIAAPQEQNTTDTLGRVITFKKMTALEKTRLYRVLGEDSANPMYMLDMMIAAVVSDIDGVPTPPKTTIAMLESTIERLSDEGMNAVKTALLSNQKQNTLQADVKN
jgi:hypothetical protein